MGQFDFLNDLLAFEQPGAPVISVYLNTEPNETGKKDFDVFLGKQIKEHGSVLAEDSAERESYNADAEKIDNFARRIDPATRGVAIFACGGADGLFKTFQFAIPFEQDSFTVGPMPRLYPIIHLISRNPVYAVAAADTNRAHIYVFKRGHVIDEKNIENEVTNRSEVGGWSQMRYQRHVDNFHQQHAKEVAEDIDKLVRDEGVKRLVLAGDEKVIIPMLKKELSHEATNSLIGVLNLKVDAPEHEIAEAAEGLLKEKESEFDKEKIANLIEQNYDEGLGVVGVEKTLAALLNGQVQELYLNADISQINYSRGEVRKILKDYEPGTDGDLPDAAERDALIDDLLIRAASSADNIRFIEDPHLLKSLGGVGALLRYQVKGVTSS